MVIIIKIRKKKLIKLGEEKENGMKYEVKIIIKFKK